MQAVEDACAATASWLTELPAWPRHPTNASGSVSAHYGPTILSEHDCVMQFARHLSEAGVPWEDIHPEFSPAQWMFERPDGSELRPKRIDLLPSQNTAFLQVFEDLLHRLLRRHVRGVDGQLRI